MIALAFKIAAKTGSLWSELIAHASGSPYSHVELWLDGPVQAAYCFSSREPHGASFQTIDLSGPEWEIVPLKLTEMQIATIYAFCRGADGKEYDGLGLIGYKFGTGQHDNHDVFCSEVCASACQKCAGLFLGKAPWLISPGDLHAMAIAS